MVGRLNIQLMREGGSTFCLWIEIHSNLRDAWIYMWPQKDMKEAVRYLERIDLVRECESK